MENTGNSVLKSAFNKKYVVSTISFYLIGRYIIQDEGTGEKENSRF